MKQYEYQSYDEYVKAQIEANKKKINNIWVRENTIKKIKNIKTSAKNILCHGTRNAREQQYFLNFYPDANVIGTEISDTANKFPYTIQHDFHEQKDEWIGKFDIVYSNSWDHSYDPRKTLSVWFEQLNEDGILFIEHASNPEDNRARKSDPLEIYGDEILNMIHNELKTNDVITFDTTGSSNKKTCTVYAIRK